MEYKNILTFTTDFHNNSTKVKRFVQNPYVRGDNIPEHIALGVRLLSYIAKPLKEEFGSKLSMGDLYTTFIIHDDDEIIDKKDIVTYRKNHNSKDNTEIEEFKERYNFLSNLTSDYIVKLFSNFRKKDSVEAKIAKQVDNIVGNMLVVDQKVGLIAPHIAKFAIEYVEKVKKLSGSQVLKELINAQIEQIYEERNALLKDRELLERVLKPYAKVHNLQLDLLIEKSVKLLSINLDDIELEDKQIDLLIQDYP